MVGVAAGEDLRLVFQPAEGAGMDHAIAIPLKRIAIGVRRLGIAASTGILHANSVAGEHRRSLAATRRGRQARAHRKGAAAAAPWFPIGVIAWSPRFVWPTSPLSLIHI